MYARLAVVLAVSTATAAAQFSGLSASRDGSSVYFASTLRLRHTAQPLNGKIFLASSDGVRLIAARETVEVPASTVECALDGFRDYIGAQTTSGGVIALYYEADTGGRCTYQPSATRTQVVTPAGQTTVPGIARLSASGRYAVVIAPKSRRPPDGGTVSVRDFQTGTDLAIEFPPNDQSESITGGYGGGRLIADDGTAVVGIVSGRGLWLWGDDLRYLGYIVKRGAAPASFPIPNVLPSSISADAARVLYLDREQSLHLLDLHTKQSVFLGSDGGGPISVSDDATRMVLVQNGRIRAIDSVGPSDRLLSPENMTVARAVISGDGSVVYAVTDLGRLLKISFERGSEIELIGETPYLTTPPFSMTPGLGATLNGTGLSESVIDGRPPFAPFLGRLTMWIGERKVPVFQVGPTSVHFLVPWDVAGEVRIVAEVHGRNTPFDVPQVDAIVADSSPRAGAIARETWERTYVGPVKTGEVIHILAIGLGPVMPEMPDGVPAPSEPLARLSKRLTCSNSDVLYAGLAPGYVERVYQVDLRVGPTPGYQQFHCTLDGGRPFLFLTLNVVD